MSSISTPSKGTILWDVDGTIISPVRKSIKSPHISTILKYGIEPNLSAETLIGSTDFEVLENMLHNYKNGDKYDVLVDCFKVLDQESLEIYNYESFDLCLGMPDVLIEVHKHGWNNGILTGNTRNRMKMKLMQIIDLFDPNLIFECKLGDTRENIARRASDLFTSKGISNTIIVGDTPRDISVAKEFGFQVVSVATGKFTIDALEKFKPHLLLKNFKHDAKNFLKFIDAFNN